MVEMQGPIEFAIQTPSDDAAVRSQIAHALTLGLPEVDCAQKRLHLIANGPSARNFNFNAAAHWHHFGETALCDTMAINGALKLFTDRNCAPTYWIACDPQGPTPDLTTPADFLTGHLPAETTYLVASKCHPAVFDLLKDRRVKLWHVNDQPVSFKRQVPCAVSVTLCAMMLANRLGYRNIDVWGWDACFAEDGAHHAATGELGITSDKVEIEVGDGPETLKFMSTATWACEVKDASGILPVLKWCGTDVVIHGRSMISAILPEFAAAPFLEAA